MVWCGVVWCGVVWCGVVWCGEVWWGLAYTIIIQMLAIERYFHTFTLLFILLYKEVL